MNKLTKEEKMIELDSGVLQKIMNNHNIEKPILQVLNIRNISSVNQGDRYLLLLSDGTYFESACLLLPNLNTFIKTQKLKKDTIIQLDKYALNSIPNGKVLVIVDLTIVNNNYPKIGNPVGLTQKNLNNKNNNNSTTTTTTTPPPPPPPQTTTQKDEQISETNNDTSHHHHHLHSHHQHQNCHNHNHNDINAVIINNNNNNENDDMCKCSNCQDKNTLKLCYKMLGLNEDATKDEVRSKYLSLVTENNEKVKTDPKTAEKFDLMTKAYTLIMGIKSDESSDSGESDDGSGIMIDECDSNKLRNKSKVKIPLEDFLQYAWMRAADEYSYDTDSDSECEVGFHRRKNRNPKAFYQQMKKNNKTLSIKAMKKRAKEASSKTTISINENVQVTQNISSSSSTSSGCSSINSACMINEDVAEQHKLTFKIKPSAINKIDTKKLNINEVKKVENVVQKSKESSNKKNINENENNSNNKENGENKSSSIVENEPLSKSKKKKNKKKKRNNKLNTMNDDQQQPEKVLDIKKEETQNTKTTFQFTFQSNTQLDNSVIDNNNNKEKEDEESNIVDGKNCDEFDDMDDAEDEDEDDDDEEDDDDDDDDDTANDVAVSTIAANIENLTNAFITKDNTPENVNLKEKLKNIVCSLQTLQKVIDNQDFKMLTKLTTTKLIDDKIHNLDNIKTSTTSTNTYVTSQLLPNFDQLIMQQASDMDMSSMKKSHDFVFTEFIDSDTERMSNEAKNWKLKQQISQINESLSSIKIASSNVIKSKDKQQMTSTIRLDEISDIEHKLLLCKQEISNFDVKALNDLVNVKLCEKHLNEHVVVSDNQSEQKEVSSKKSKKKLKKLKQQQQKKQQQLQPQPQKQPIIETIQSKQKPVESKKAEKKKKKAALQNQKVEPEPQLEPEPEPEPESIEYEPQQVQTTKKKKKSNNKKTKQTQDIIIKNNQNGHLSDLDSFSTDSIVLSSKPNNDSISTKNRDDLLFVNNKSPLSDQIISKNEKNSYDDPRKNVNYNNNEDNGGNEDDDDDDGNWIQVKKQPTKNSVNLKTSVSRTSYNNETDKNVMKVKSYNTVVMDDSRKLSAIDTSFDTDYWSKPSTSTTSTKKQVKSTAPAEVANSNLDINVTKSIDDLKNLVPKSIDEEEIMLRKALELSLKETSEKMPVIQVKQQSSKLVPVKVENVPAKPKKFDCIDDFSADIETNSQSRKEVNTQKSSVVQSTVSVQQHPSKPQQIAKSKVELKTVVKQTIKSPVKQPTKLEPVQQQTSSRILTAPVVSLLNEEQQKKINYAFSSNYTNGISYAAKSAKSIENFKSAVVAKKDLTSSSSFSNFTSVDDFPPVTVANIVAAKPEIQQPSKVIVKPGRVPTQTVNPLPQSTIIKEDPIVVPQPEQIPIHVEEVKSPVVEAEPIVLNKLVEEEEEVASTPTIISTPPIPAVISDPIPSLNEPILIKERPSSWTTPLIIPDVQILKEETSILLPKIDNLQEIVQDDLAIIKKPTAIKKPSSNSLSSQKTSSLSFLGDFKDNGIDVPIDMKPDGITSLIDSPKKPVGAERPTAIVAPSLLSQKSISNANTNMPVISPSTYSNIINPNPLSTRSQLLPSAIVAPLKQQQQQQQPIGFNVVNMDNDNFNIPQSQTLFTKAPSPIANGIDTFIDNFKYPINKSLASPTGSSKSFDPLKQSYQNTNVQQISLMKQQQQQQQQQQKYFPPFNQFQNNTTNKVFTNSTKNINDILQQAQLHTSLRAPGIPLNTSQYNQANYTNINPIYTPQHLQQQQYIPKFNATIGSASSTQTATIQKVPSNGNFNNFLDNNSLLFNNGNNIQQNNLYGFHSDNDSQMSCVDLNNIGMLTPNEQKRFVLK